VHHELVCNSLPAAATPSAGPQALLARRSRAGLLLLGALSVASLLLVLALSSTGARAGAGVVCVLALLAATALLSSAWLCRAGARVRALERHVEDLARAGRALREAGVQKDEFLASVSHEIRTPVNVVLGYADLLLEDAFGKLAPAQREIVQRIGKNADDLSRLINDLIDLSRLDAGRLKIEIGAVDLAPLFGELSGIVEVMLAGKAGEDVSFTASVAADCPRVSADPDRLKQILSNLLVNAAKFTERGSIALRAERRGEDQVLVSVTDTGVGIPPSAHAAIFEPFRQLHEHGRTGGAGIGLAVSARLAQRMGGTLAVESEPGRGARFTLTLPACGRVEA